METTIGDYIGTTIGIHSPIPYKSQVQGFEVLALSLNFTVATWLVNSLS